MVKVGTFFDFRVCQCLACVCATNDVDFNTIAKVDYDAIN